MASLAGAAAVAGCDNPLARTRSDGVHDVTKYGARGDGRADDTGAIRAAAAAAGFGGTVYFPPGTYRTGPQFLFDGQTWRGASRRGSVLQMNEPGANSLVGMHGSSCTLLDMGLTTLYPERPQAAQHGVAITGQNNRVESCWIDTGFWWGGFVWNHATGCGFLGCEIDGTVGAHAIEINDSSYCFVERCQLKNASHNGVEIYPKTDDEGIGNRVVGNRIEGCGGAGVGMYGGHGSLVESNVLLGNRTHGILLDAVEPVRPVYLPATDNRVVNNLILDSGLLTNGFGLWLVNSTATLVQGNTISGSGNGGIFVGSSRHSLVSNSCTLNRRSGIVLNRSTEGVAIMANQCNDNSTAGVSQGHGIVVEGSRHTLTGNVCSDTRADRLQEHGIILNCVDSTATGNILTGNRNLGLYDIGAGNVTSGNAL